MLKPVRLFLLLCYFLVSALFCILICLLRPFNPDNTRVCGRIFSWGGLKILGIQLTVEGKEHLENMQAGVIVANHQSNYDLFVHGCVIPSRAVSLGKQSLKYLPLFGQVYWLAGNILINRSNSKQSKDTLDEVTQAITQQNTTIWVFPEGTRNPAPGLLPFKKGAFHMALKAQAPLFPICASSFAQQIDLNKWNAGKVFIRILPPIPTEGLSRQDIDVLIENTHSSMQTTIDELDRLALS
jgi:1-acyl-sn-glycerol-3-phosphate acyltransferase